MNTITSLRLLTALLVAAVVLSSSIVSAQQMNYQGRLTDSSGDPVVDGQRVLTFNLYDAAAGGANTWGPFVTDGGPGNGHSALADLVNGRFNVVLGPTDTLGRTLVNGFGGGNRYLEIKEGANPPISPRQQILAAPEALHALIADTVALGAIGTAQLANGSVTAEKIAGGTGVWIGSGADVYRAGGNVGIGTSAPGFPLTFAEALGDKISLYSEGLNSWGFGIQSGLLQIHTGNQIGDVAFGYGSSAAMTETMRIKGTGNVGIGTSNPGAKLHVAGTMTVSSPAFGGPVGYGLVGVDGNERAQFAIPATPGQYSTDAAAGDTVIRATTGRLLLQTGAGASAIAITDGSVGIGTTSPGQAKLVVNGFGGVTGPANYYKAEYQVGIGDVSGAPRNIGIYANQSIWSGAALISSSDQRIKNIQGQSDRAADLQTLLGIEITDFRYKDAVAKGNAPHKKVIAQQVEKVFPQAVSKQTDVVPDIYRTAPIQNGWVTLTTSLKKGERVKLITEKNEESIHEVLEVTRDKFRTDFITAGDKIFVYGREVKDFRTVDYEAIAMLNVSATQELARRLEQLELREAHLATLEAKASQLATLEEEMAEMKRALAQLTAAGDAPQASKLPH